MERPIRGNCTLFLWMILALRTPEGTLMFEIEAQQELLAFCHVGASYKSAVAMSINYGE
jgi:hypothetical protein